MAEQRELKEYNVILNGTPTTVQLTEEDFHHQGWELAEGSSDTYVKPKHGTSTPVTSGKARTSSKNKAADEGSTK